MGKRLEAMKIANLDKSYTGDISRDLHNLTANVSIRQNKKGTYKLFTKGEVKYIDISEVATNLWSFINSRTLSSKDKTKLWDDLDTISIDKIISAYN